MYVMIEFIDIYFVKIREFATAYKRFLSKQ